MTGEVNPSELLRFATAPNITGPVDFIPSIDWGAIQVLSIMDESTNLDRDIAKDEKERCTAKLCMLRALRPDGMCYEAIRGTEVWREYVSNRTVPLL